jgi:addiction module HigA family antidote
MLLPKHRRPTHPGQILLEEFLMPLGITQKEAAERLRMSYPRMNEIVKGKRAVTPDTALRFAKFTGTEPEFWLNLQQAVDLWDALRSTDAAELKAIKPAQVA